MRVQRSKVVSTAGPPGLLKRPKKTAPLVDPNPPVGQEHLPPPRSKWADWSTSRRRLDAAGLAELAEALLASPEPSPKERLALRRALARRLPAEARRALASLPLLRKPIPSLQDILRLLADAASLLLTADLVVPAGWSVAAKNLSASGVPGSSGDWMRLIPRADGTLAIALADLEGHDRASNEAARYLDRLLGPEWGQGSPDAELITLERRLASLGAAPGAPPLLVDAMLPILFAVLDPQAMTLELSSAAHPPPLLVRDGEVQRLNAVGAFVGVAYELDHQVSRTQLRAGDVLFFATDGVTEAPNARCELFADWLEGHLGALTPGGPANIAEAVFQQLDGHRGAVVPEDDTTLLVLKASGPPRGADS